MSQIIINQFSMARNWTIELAEDLTEEIANMQPEGFNNTIKWQLGHIIGAAEYFMRILPGNQAELPVLYQELFSPGTRPSEWKSEPPHLSEITIELKKQLERINKISPEQLKETLKEPVHHFNTVADSASFCVLHESVHVGQIQIMKQFFKV
ncbi:DinB family protein [Fictibacillus fluitans]|uniref:DinB family protein n=1 Tax=Fictibacillus fluitans TaxID=3058422 RepID=A0ABT8HW59_9BACL|nr:DinB family protein [Fictibacillus sp. NE201]MDN4525011.1 DinB family protein [Fictibacillus sp. NE201]